MTRQKADYWLALIWTFIVLVLAALVYGSLKQFQCEQWCGAREHRWRIYDGCFCLQGQWRRP